VEPHTQRSRRAALATWVTPGNVCRLADETVDRLANRRRSREAAIVGHAQYVRDLRPRLPKPRLAPEVDDECGRRPEMMNQLGPETGIRGQQVCPPQLPDPKSHR
jgi:hypothetical protein